jgi:DNA-directed RNA polymerase subunit RPC12/RpoP
MVRRGSTQVTDYRAVMNGTGDVSVGAYARVQRRKRILVGLAGVALIGGAVLVHTVLRPREANVAGGPLPVLVRCVAEGCGYEGVMPVPRGQAESEIVCPKCMQHSCRKVWQCRNCGAQFVPKRGAPDIRCPKCRSRQVGAAYEPAQPGSGG